MNCRPDFTDPWEAAQVSTFMEPAEQGRWKIMRFTITEQEYRHSQVAALAQGGAQGLMRLERTIPPGDYITLLRKATPLELKDIEEEKVVDSVAPHPGYVPIMSDSPSEILEHRHAIDNAHGRVLITGLGLGCIVSALLAKPCSVCEGGTIRPHLSRPGDGWRCPGCGGSGKAVQHITVVEIDRDVIALTGPYYEDEPRVEIWNGDALKFAQAMSAGAHAREHHFDYAWHDIWSHIADRNLSDDTLAEHGISYATIQMAYSPFVDMQGAWAFEEAKAMRDVKERERQRLASWAQKFVDGTDEERMQLLMEFVIRQRVPQLPADEPVPENVLNFFIEHMDLWEHTKQVLAERADDIVEKTRTLLAGELPLDPMDRPNEYPEANVP